MTTTIDADYYERRRVQERAQADRASDPIVRRVHSELADHYERMAIPMAPAA